MERLIAKTATGGYTQNNAGDLWRTNGSKLINKRLYEYESTGITPADIAAMQAELSAYKQGEKDGTLVRVKFAQGEMVWHGEFNVYRGDGFINEEPYQTTPISEFYNNGDVINTKSKEEAEKWLAEYETDARAALPE